MNEGHSAPAGWYPDPEGGPTQRYLDGTQRAATMPKPPPIPPFVPSPQTRGGHPTRLPVLTLLSCWPVFVILLWRRPIGRGAKIGITLAVIAVASLGTIATVAAMNSSNTTRSSPPPTVTSVSNLCDQYFDLTIGSAG